MQRLLAVSLAGLVLGAASTDNLAVCQTYDPTKIQVVAPSTNFYANPAWTIESAGQPLEHAASRDDADRVATVALYYSVECRIVSNRPQISTVTYWQAPVKPLDLPFQEDCLAYDPSEISFHHNVVGDLRPVPRTAIGPIPPRLLLTVPGDKEGNAVLALARQFTQACVIGGWQPAPTTGMDTRAAREAQNAWHPVYYWKK